MMASSGDLLRFTEHLSDQLILNKEKNRSKKERIWKTLEEIQQRDDTKQEIRCLETYIKKQDREIDSIYDILQSLIKVQKKTLILLQGQPELDHDATSTTGIPKLASDDSSDTENAADEDHIVRKLPTANQRLNGPEKSSTRETDKSQRYFRSPGASKDDTLVESGQDKGSENKIAATNSNPRSETNEAAGVNTTRTGLQTSVDGRQSSGVPSSSTSECTPLTDVVSKTAGEVTTTANKTKDNAQAAAASDKGTVANQEAVIVPVALWERLSDEAEDTAKSLSNSARESDPDKAIGMYTVICLDTSASMTGQRWKTAHEFLQTYLHHLEIEATEFDRNDHVALVVFGVEIKVVSHFTREYTRILDYCATVSPSGSSNLFAALALCLGIIKGGYIRCVYGDRVFTCPRLVLITDGHATRPNIIGGQDVHLGTEGLDAARTITQVIAENDGTKMYPLMVQDCNQTFLRRLATITGGRLLMEGLSNSEAFTVKRFFRQHRNYVLAGREMRDRWLLFLFSPRPSVDATAEDEEDIREIIREQTNAHEEHIDDDNHLLDVSANMPPLGARVRRGPEWGGLNQDDGQGCGTVIGHRDNGCVRVCWDNSKKGIYLYGKDGRYEVIIVEEPKVMEDQNYIITGCRVVRGPDWESNDDDGSIKEDDVGIVIRTRPYGMVKVVWPSGKIDNYAFGFRQTLEVQPCRSEQKQVSVRQKVTAISASDTRSNNISIGTNGNQTKAGADRLSRSHSSDTVSKPPKPDTHFSESASSSKPGVKAEGSGTEPASDIKSSKVVNENTKKQNRRNKNLKILTTPDRSRSNSISLTQSSDIDKLIWQYKVRDKSWKTFSAELCDKIEQIFINNSSRTLQIDQGGQPYRVIPSAMQLVHLPTKTVSEIQRVLR